MQDLKNVAKAAAMIMAINLLGKVLGFVREVIIASRFGAGIQSDAYYMALTIPGLMFSAVAMALSTTFIPLYAECQKKEGSLAANRYTSNIINILILSNAGLCSLGIMFTPFILRTIAPGFTGERFVLTVTLSRIMLPMIIFQTVAAVLVGYLQANRRFIAPALVGFITNVFIISATLYFTGQYGVYALAVGTLLGFGLQFAVMLPSSLRLGYRWSAALNLKDGYLRRMAILVIPVLLGTLVLQFNELVSKAFASGFPTGSVAALSYANRLNLFAYSTVSLPIATVLYPTLTQLSVDLDMDGLRDTVSSALNMIMLLMVPAAVALMVLRVPVVSVLFMRGAFDDTALRATTTILFFFTFGMTALGFRDVIARAFYALQDTRTPAVNSAVTVVLNITLIFILTRLIGLGGLALAPSLSVTSGGILFIYTLRKKLGSINGTKILTCFGKVLASAIPMGIALHLLSTRLSTLFDSGTILIKAGALGFCILFGLVIYGIMVILLRVEEVYDLLGVFKIRKCGTLDIGDIS